MRRGLAALGLEVTGLRAYDRPFRIVTVGRLGCGGHEVTDDPWLRAISQLLKDASVAHTVRRGMLRFAFHIFNTDQEVDSVLALVASVKRPA